MVSSSERNNTHPTLKTQLLSYGTLDIHSKERPRRLPSQTNYSQHKQKDPLPEATSGSQPRVNLIQHRFARKRRPISASISHDTWNVQMSNISRSLHNSDVETSQDVPRDMAMQQPGTRIVRRDLQHKEPSGRKDLHVSPLRIRRIDHSSVPAAGPDVQNEHVVAVQVDRM